MMACSNHRYAPYDVGVSMLLMLTEGEEQERLRAIWSQQQAFDTKNLLGDDSLWGVKVNVQPIMVLAQICWRRIVVRT